MAKSPPLAPATEETSWHCLETQEVLGKLAVEAAIGLREAEAGRRLTEFGQNELLPSEMKSSWLILWEQLKALMVLILIAAALVSALLGDYGDTIAIGTIVVLNALLGFFEEYRSEKAIVALKKLTVSASKVRRDGEMHEVPSIGLVPGDIVVLEAGSLVPADCRVLESANLYTQEAALTGESQPVCKLTAAVKLPDVPLADRNNMVYMGTAITAGRGLAAVTETGMRTELGRIAGMIRNIEREPTPLQKRLGHLAKHLAAAALVIVGLIFFLGLLRGESLKLMFLTAVSIGVAAVPEGLSAVVTITLTLGAHRILKRKALIRKLSAVETLGSVTVICSDKTGTLTENRMAVEILQLADQRLEVPHHDPARQDSRSLTLDHPGFRLLLVGGALCNDALMSSSAEEPGSLASLGDPTETALVLGASRFGLRKTELEKAMPRVAEVPFSSHRKRMTTVHRMPHDSLFLPSELQTATERSRDACVAFTKGGIEPLLDVCTTVWVGEKREALDQVWRRHLLEANDGLAAKGMRLLGVAFRQWNLFSPGCDEETVEQGLTFIGMIGLTDPPRPEAASAVATCKAAGIRPVMITGDHPLTAQYIAAQIGIESVGPALTGAQMDRLARSQLDHMAESTRLYARVSPEHKLAIVESLQRNGHIVAMTGDGVNDAPALKKADIGVAMGVNGTDVAKQAADMVLLDDNFATIVLAVQEGRVIYDNLRKFIRYILATNSGEIWVMLLTPFFGMPLPLLPLQILWMNLVTDGLPALALSAEPPESDAMRRPPYPRNESIFARGLGRHVVWVGLLMGLLTLSIGLWYWQANNPKWQTMVFTTLTLSQMAHILAIRSEHLSLFRIGFFSNTLLVAAVVSTVLLQLALVYVPFLQDVFRTTALSPSELALSVVLSGVIFCAVEAEKWTVRRRSSQDR